ERQQLDDWNDTDTADLPARCFHTLFEEQVAKTPEQVALVHEGIKLSYAELNRRANQLAHHLRRLGVGTETLVALCVERSIEMVVGLLGILKAGGAFVPLDPSHPQKRLSFTLNDTQAPVILTQASLAAAFAEQQARVLCLDWEWETISSESEQNPPGIVGPANLAYVIYTSGSTGQPKGVQVTHGALSNHMLWMREEIPLNATDRLLQKTSFTFDASIWEFFLPLMCGAQLVLARPGGQQDSAYLVETLMAEEITVLQVVPTMLRVLLAEKDISRCRSLRRLFCGGEVVTNDLQERFFSHFDETELYNLYGPTEATIQVTCWHCERESQMVVPIGRPIPNVQFYVLDAQLQPVPVGVAGELYIGGASLARGYLNRPDLTAERFIPNPFSHTAGARLYRTGDLTRYREDGRLEFLGRKDSQVKLRGFRIELGEIESVLGQHESVQTGLAVVREDSAGEPRLVAYVIASEGRKIETAELRQYLSQRLPLYMVPAVFVTLEALPLLSNGKIDRKALPAPEAMAEVREFVAPRTPIEEMLAGLWREVLGVDRVGATDDFFELGGHSLLATRLLSRVRDAFRVDVPLRHIFEHSRLAEFATVLEAEMSGASVALAPAIVPVSRDQVLPLSFAQQRLWFIEQLEPTAAAYHISQAIRLTGDLNVEALRNTFNEIVRRHEVLRTVFVVNDGEPAQVIIPSLTVELPLVDLSALPESEREASTVNECAVNAQQPFDLEHGPLFRLKLLMLGSDEYVLIVTLHHIVADGWSFGVLVGELTTLYRSFITNNSSPLPELPIQYADFAYWQRDSSDEVSEKELDYWRRQLAGPLPVLALPADRQRPAQLSYRGGTLSFTLSPELTTKLNRLSHTHRSTLFMTLLAAFQTLLHRYTGQEDIVVGTPIANRQRLELENLIGFFVNTLPIRVDLGGDLVFSELLARVREAALGAYSHQRMPFEKLVQVLQPERDLSYSPVFQVLFALQNAPTQKLDLPQLTLAPQEFPGGATRFELECLMWEQNGQLSGVLVYSEDLFEEATISNMLANFEVLLEAIANTPDERINALPLLTHDKEHQL
ncbi:MAG TPA: amino acid adenylation domain-containing protein, partial [Pyrinomonadaceae bacterium]|nr:amino acid adenylation domain-containing protein [Pyrinomonadaceae bacterium]